MRSRPITFIAAASIVLLAAAPAFAKIDLRSVTIRGPGVAAPIVLRGDDAWAFLVGGGNGPEDPPEAVPPPGINGSTGPEYSVVVDQGQMGPPLRLRLHPFAIDGPALWIGHSQTLRWMIEWSERPEHTGWVAVSERQLQLLWAEGFPKQAPAAPSAPPASAAPSPVEPDRVRDTTAAARSSGRPPVVAFLSLAALTLTGVVVVSRRRFRGMAKPGG